MTDELQTIEGTDAAFQKVKREDAYGRVGIPEQCLTCDGVGRADDDTCGTCGGEGFVCWWGAVGNQEKERAKHAHSFLHNFQSLPYQWRGMKPETVCAGSPAQILFCVRDAQKDIVAALAEIDRLRAALRVNGLRAGHTHEEIDRVINRA